MTTIALDKTGQLAADSCYTVYRGKDPLRREYHRKLREYIVDAEWRLYIATAGDQAPCNRAEVDLSKALAELASSGSIGDLFSNPYFTPVELPGFRVKPLKEREKPEDAEDDTTDPDGGIWGIAILRSIKSGRAIAFRLDGDSYLYPCEPGKFYAVGSDSAAASAALDMGLNAVDAIRLAAKYGCYTGGDIHFVGGNDWNVRKF
jgi:hypothetical protein